MNKIIQIRIKMNKVGIRIQEDMAVSGVTCSQQRRGETIARVAGLFVCIRPLSDRYERGENFLGQSAFRSIQICGEELQLLRSHYTVYLVRPVTSVSELIVWSVIRNKDLLSLLQKAFRQPHALLSPYSSFPTQHTG